MMSSLHRRTVEWESMVLVKWIKKERTIFQSGMQNRFRYFGKVVKRIYDKTRLT